MQCMKLKKRKLYIENYKKARISCRRWTRATRCIRLIRERLLGFTGLAASTGFNPALVIFLRVLFLE